MKWKVRPKPAATPTKNNNRKRRRRAKNHHTHEKSKPKQLRTKKCMCNETTSSVRYSVAFVHVELRSGYCLSFVVLCVLFVRSSFIRTFSITASSHHDSSVCHVTSRHIMSPRVSFAKVARQICWVRNVFLIISEEAKILNYFSVDYISLFDFVASALLYKSKVRT